MDSKTKWTYIAGFFDGEGSIVTLSTRSIMIDITNSDLELLKWIERETGVGKIYDTKVDISLGGRHKTYKYRVFRQSEMLKFLTKLTPQLRIKKTLGTLGIKFLKSRTDNPQHHITDDENQIWLRMRKLNAERSGHARAARNYFQVPRE